MTNTSRRDSDEPFLVITCEEEFTNDAQPQEAPAKEQDPLYAPWGEQGKAQWVEAPSYGVRKLKELYPGHSVVAFNSWNANVMGFPGALVQPVSPPEVVSETFFFPVARQSGQSAGFAGNSVRFGAFHVAWDKYDFILYNVMYSLAFGETSKGFLVHKGPEQPIRALLIAAGIWQNDLHNEVYVFDGGFWQKDGSLWHEIQKANWDDIILKDEYKKRIQKDVFGFFDSEDLYKRLAIPWKRGVIMHGPPGNGKTISLKAIMKDADAKGYYPLYVKSFRSWKGDEGAMKDVFDKARQVAPCVVVLEDLDSLITPQNRSFFLNQIDGLENNDGLLVIGTTNHLENIDPALRSRPSRFDRKFMFDDPDAEERKLYVQYWQNKLKSNKDIDFPDSLAKEIVDTTNKFSFAYLKEAFVSTLVILAGLDDDDKRSFADVLKTQINALKKQLGNEPEVTSVPTPVVGQNPPRTENVLSSPSRANTATAAAKADQMVQDYLRSHFPYANPASAHVPPNGRPLPTAAHPTTSGQPVMSGLSMAMKGPQYPYRTPPPPAPPPMVWEMLSKSTASSAIPPGFKVYPTTYPTHGWPYAPASRQPAELLAGSTPPSVEGSTATNKESSNPDVARNGLTMQEAWDKLEATAQENAEATGKPAQSSTASDSLAPAPTDEPPMVWELPSKSNTSQAAPTGFKMYPTVNYSVPPRYPYPMQPSQPLASPSVPNVEESTATDTTSPMSDAIRYRQAMQITHNRLQALAQAGKPAESSPTASNSLEALAATGEKSRRPDDVTRRGLTVQEVNDRLSAVEQQINQADGESAVLTTSSGPAANDSGKKSRRPGDVTRRRLTTQEVSGRLSAIERELVQTDAQSAEVTASSGQASPAGTPEAAPPRKEMTAGELKDKLDAAVDFTDTLLSRVKRTPWAAPTMKRMGTIIQDLNNGMDPDVEYFFDASANLQSPMQPIRSVSSEQIGLRDKPRTVTMAELPKQVDTLTANYATIPSLLPSSNPNVFHPPQTRANRKGKPWALGSDAMRNPSERISMPGGLPVPGAESSDAAQQRQEEEEREKEMHARALDAVKLGRSYFF